MTYLWPNTASNRNSINNYELSDMIGINLEIKFAA